MKPTKTLIGVHIEKLNFLLYNAFDSFYYQTLKRAHFEKLEHRLFNPFDSFDYQTLKGVHFGKLDFRMYNRLIAFITKHVGPPIVREGVSSVFQ